MVQHETRVFEEHGSSPAECGMSLIPVPLHLVGGTLYSLLLKFMF